MTARVLSPIWSRKSAEAIVGLVAANNSSLVALDAAGALLFLDADGEPIEIRRPAACAGLRIVASPTGDRIAASWEDGSLAIYAGADWRTLAGNSAGFTLSGAGWLDCFEWSPDGRRLAVALQRELWILNQDGELERRFLSAAGSLQCLAWAADSATVYAGATKGVCRFRLETSAAEELASKGPALHLSLSPDGLQLAAALYENRIQVLRLSGGGDLVMRGYAARVAALAFDGAGDFLASAGGSRLIVWDFRESAPVGRAPFALDAHAEKITLLAWRPGRSVVASGGDDGRVVVWAPAGGAEEALLLSGSAALTALAWDASGARLYCGDQSGRISACQPPEFF